MDKSEAIAFLVLQMQIFFFLSLFIPSDEISQVSILCDSILAANHCYSSPHLTALPCIRTRTPVEKGSSNPYQLPSKASRMNITTCEVHLAAYLFVLCTHIHTALLGSTSKMYLVPMLRPVDLFHPHNKTSISMRRRIDILTHNCT